VSDSVDSSDVVVSLAYLNHYRRVGSQEGPEAFFLPGLTPDGPSMEREREKSGFSMRDRNSKESRDVVNCAIRPF
jgi:hypothetical protein